MANDINKWLSQPTSGEVTENLVNIRIAMIQLFGMIASVKVGNEAAFKEAQEKFIKVDLDLQKSINRIGGLDGPK
jgi:hypothetical protein